MNTKLENYIPLYMGWECEAITTKSSYRNPEVGVILEINHNANFNEEVVICAENGYYLCGFEQCKLLLRPFSDMTDEERIEIARIVLHRYQKHYKDPVNLVVKNKIVHVLNPLNTSLYTVEIAKDGIHYYHELAGKSSCPTVNQYEAVRYMLKKQLDIFGLIESGIAIDKTTFKIKNNG